MGLGNPYVKEHMDALFGSARFRNCARLELLSPVDRELTIIEELSKALGASGSRYVLPFGFRNAAGTRTSHHLIFVSKVHSGYEIMKELWPGKSSCHDQGYHRLTTTLLIASTRCYLSWVARLMT